MSIVSYTFIQKIVVGFFVLIFSGWTLSIYAQPGSPESATGCLEKERISFLQNFNPLSVDSNIAVRLYRFMDSEVDSIHRSVMANAFLPDSEKTKAIQSLVYFIQELCQNLSMQKSEIYDIPGTLESYKLLFNAFLNHTSYDDILENAGPRRSQLLATAFWEFNEGKLLNDVAIYKRVISAPDYILTFLEMYPGFRFADSLILFAINYNPNKIASRLRQDQSFFKRVRQSKLNLYLQTIASLSKNKNVSELLPFLMLLAENKLTTDDIIEKRKDATGYFQLLVNTLEKFTSGHADSSFMLLKPLRNAIKEKAVSFYVNPLNELHSAAEEIRFASVKELRIEDLYYIITGCEDELYTSSYLGLYKRLMEHPGTNSADALFEAVKYDQFRSFIRMAANYNTLGDFLSHMPLDKAVGILKQYISGIENDTYNGLEKAMDIADSFAGFNSVPGISILIRDELKSNLERCESAQSYFGMRLYNILLKVFDLLQQKDDTNKLWTDLGNPEILERKALQNKYGEIIQLVLFYGDDDGIASYNNFLGLFKDPAEWEVIENDLWVTIRSNSDQPIFIYANRPLDGKKELDLLAQDSLCNFLNKRHAEPVIVIHRGHSYHLPNTLKRLNSSVKLTILGSCGGSNNLISIAGISPGAQIIVSKKMGSQLINDPLINMINETLRNKKDLVWTDLWKKLTTRFMKDEFVLNLFNEYMPPSKNVSLFVLKLFQFYK